MRNQQKVDSFASVITFDEQKVNSNKNSAMTQEDLQKLRDRLPSKSVKLIQNELKDQSFSPSYISRVLSGIVFNEKIITAAIRVAENHEAELEALAKAARGEEKLDKLKFNLQNQ